MAKGIQYLRQKLAIKQIRVRTRYSFYEMKNLTKDFGISTPPDLRYWMGSLGWCAKSVDSLADRLQFYKFADDNFDLNTIYQLNNADTLFDSAILSACISSCSFIYIRADENGYPALQVIDGSRATGIIEPRTNMLQEGYAVLEEDDNHNPTLEAYFEKGLTTFYPKGEEPYSVENPAPYPLLVPIIFRPDAKRPFGHSRISRACMSIQGSAIRTIKRSEIAAEFYSYPQKYITGLSQDAERMEKWKATMSSLLTFTKDEDGDSPTVGAFSQASMSPHTDQLKMLAGLFAGETGLTLDDLGFASGNPQSADAIKASHENLRLIARKAQKNFGIGFLNAGYLAACIRDDFPYERNQLYMTHAIWEPVFEPDASQLGVIGDAVVKLNQALPNYLDGESIRQLTGIEGTV